MTPRPPTSTLFPYTTLFRSGSEGRRRRTRPEVRPSHDRRWPRYGRRRRRSWRSEEHTSELQSHSDLVCRPLLEKKEKLDMRGSTQLASESSTPAAFGPCTAT